MLSDLLLCLPLLSMDQAELRNSGLNVADLQRAVVARALRPPWRCPRQAPIRTIAAILALRSAHWLIGHDWEIDWRWTRDQMIHGLAQK